MEGLWALSKVGERGARASHSEYDFHLWRQSEGFFNGSCGNYEPFLARDGPFRDVCGWRGLMNFVQSRELGERASHLPRFILVGSFSYTLYLWFRF